MIIALRLPQLLKLRLCRLPLGNRRLVHKRPHQASQRNIDILRTIAQHTAVQQPHTSRSLVAVRIITPLHKIPQLGHYRVEIIRLHPLRQHIIQQRNDTRIIIGSTHMPLPEIPDTRSILIERILVHEVQPRHNIIQQLLIMIQAPLITISLRHGQ